MIFVGKRLKQARLARGLTATALANEAGVSVSIISGYERDNKTPSPDTLDKLAGILDVPARLLYKKMPEESNVVHDVFYRKVSSATKSLRDSLDQRSIWICEIFDFVEQHFDFSQINLPELNLPNDFREISNDMVEAAATSTRKLWGVDDGPIPDLTDLMETNGITVSKIGFASDKMDGFSFWHRDDFPMVVLANDKDSRSRSRFDLAHELGHLVLNHHRDNNPDPNDVKRQEDQANRFASAFLLPKESFVEDLEKSLSGSYRRSVINSLWPLKLKWKVSIAAMLYRAKDIDVIDEHQFKSAYVMLSKRGWRKDEPLEEDLPLERPEVFKQCIQCLVDDNDYTPREILEALCLSPEDIVEICGVPNNFFDERKDVKRAIKQKKLD